VPGNTTRLRRFIEGGCNRELLEIEREKLKLEISSAESKPRTPRAETNRFAANTAHLYEYYIEHWLKAEDAALALKPARMIDCLRQALKFYAIYSCDADPIGAVNIAIQETAEDLDARLPVLQEVALRLNAGIAKPEDVTRGGLPASKESPPSLGNGRQKSDKECMSGNAGAERARIYTRHAAWGDFGRLFRAWVSAGYGFRLPEMRSLRRRR